MPRKVERLTGAAVPKAAREVELPVCPSCGTVGKQPNQTDTRFFCRGGRDNPHKKVAMVPVLYRSK